MNENNEPQAWEEEFDRKVDSDNYKKEEKWGHDLVTPNDSLFDPEGYPESNFEIDPEKVKDFIRTLRLKDKERLMVGIERLKLSPIESNYAAHNKALLKVKTLITEIYE